MNKKTVFSLFVGAMFSTTAFSQDAKQNLENYLNKKALLNKKFWSLNNKNENHQNLIIVKPPFAPRNYSWLEINTTETHVGISKDFQTNMSKNSILMSKSIERK